MRSPAVWEHTSVDQSRVKELTGGLGLNPIIARLLVLRGVSTPDEASRFLDPRLDQLHDPFLLTDLRVGVDRILAAIERKERIAIHGDYDVDGVTSTVMLSRLIELLGGEVVHYIPERLADGYGLQSKNIDHLMSLGVHLIVSVDCGIRSQAAAKRARSLGIDLVITDHHEPESILPPALAVINPRRNDCPYPEKNLAGVGVAFKVVQGLCARTGHTEWLPAFLKLAALGTLADVVPLRGENRVIACLGLEQLTQGRHTVGLRNLIDSCGLTGKRIGSYEVGFVLAPRINAAGRMATPDLATRLLLSVDDAKAEEAQFLADRLDTENRRRRQEEKAILEKAKMAISSDPRLSTQKIVVVWGNNWHRGVIGIVASKLVDRLGRPVIILSTDGDVAHGSGRSIPGFDLLDALERCQDLFISFGGHHQAAGLVIQSDRLNEFRRRIVKYTDAILEPDALIPRLGIDAKLEFSMINSSLMEGLNSLEPFGIGNPNPVFQADLVKIIDGPHKLKESHLRMTLQQGHQRFRAIAWGASERKEFFCEDRTTLNLAFSLNENTFRGQTSIELNLADVK